MGGGGHFLGVHVYGEGVLRGIHCWRQASSLHCSHFNSFYPILSSFLQFLWSRVGLLAILDFGCSNLKPAARTQIISEEQFFLSTVHRSQGLRTKD